MVTPSFFARYCRFFVPPESRILWIGDFQPGLWGQLRPSKGSGVVVIDNTNRQRMQGSPEIITYEVADLDTLALDETFEYIIIHSVLDTIADVRRFLVRLLNIASPGTRIIINHTLPRWRDRLRRIRYRGSGSSSGENVSNRFSRPDLENLLIISGYEMIAREQYIWFAGPAGFFTSLVNRFLGQLPLLKRTGQGYLMVTRPDRPPANVEATSISVVMTCRDEEGNIEGLVDRIPAMGGKTEIVFVEGHSEDRTVEKIKEMMEKYPQKDIKLYHQRGVGQGDAFRLGFDKAEGDFVIWLEADLTTPPEEARHIWEAFAGGHGEFINGTRFVYPMVPEAMPRANYIGNRFFSWIISMITGHRYTDTLCGFKGISKKHYQRICEHPNSFDQWDLFGDFQLILGAARHQLKTVEVPVHYQPRQYGKPKAYGHSWLGLLKSAWPLLKISWQAFWQLRFL